MMEFTPGVRLVLLSGLACGLVALAVVIVYRMRLSPAERERQRRLRLNAFGRLGDASITDLQGDVIYYTYSVSGVSYHASQDVATLRALLPADEALLFGRRAYIKYLARNPANSILICEQWSGLPRQSEAAAPAVTPEAVN
jgi:hypothetical protein